MKKTTEHFLIIKQMLERGVPIKTIEKHISTIIRKGHVGAVDLFSDPKEYDRLIQYVKKNFGPGRTLIMGGGRTDLKVERNKDSASFYYEETGKESPYYTSTDRAFLEKVLKEAKREAERRYGTWTARNKSWDSGGLQPPEWLKSHFESRTTGLTTLQKEFSRWKDSGLYMTRDYLLALKLNTTQQITEANQEIKNILRSQTIKDSFTRAYLENPGFRKLIGTFLLNKNSSRVRINPIIVALGKLEINFRSQTAAIASWDNIQALASALEDLSQHALRQASTPRFFINTVKGKYYGKTLDWMVDNAPHMLSAYLSSDKIRERHPKLIEAISKLTTPGPSGSWSAEAARIIRERSEDQEQRSPSDLQPYYQRRVYLYRYGSDYFYKDRKGKLIKVDKDRIAESNRGLLSQGWHYIYSADPDYDRMVSYKEPVREGFAVSDNFRLETVREKQGVQILSKEETEARKEKMKSLDHFGQDYETLMETKRQEIDPFPYSIITREPHSQRRREQRFIKEYDPDRYRSELRADLNRMIRDHLPKIRQPEIKDRIDRFFGGHEDALHLAHWMRKFAAEDLKKKRASEELKIGEFAQIYDVEKYNNLERDIERILYSYSGRSQLRPEREQEREFGKAAYLIDDYGERVSSESDYTIKRKKSRRKRRYEYEYGEGAPFIADSETDFGMGGSYIKKQQERSTYNYHDVFAQAKSTQEMDLIHQEIESSYGWANIDLIEVSSSVEDEKYKLRNAFNERYKTLSATNQPI